MFESAISFWFLSHECSLKSHSISLSFHRSSKLNSKIFCSQEVVIVQLGQQLLELHESTKVSVYFNWITE